MQDARPRTERTGDDDDGCQHPGTRHPTLTPGIITCYCQHGRCLGVAMMHRVESEATAFRFLLALFKTSMSSTCWTDPLFCAAETLCVRL